MRQIHHWAALLFVAAIVGPPGPGLLHRRLPPPPGAELDHRRRRCCILAIVNGFAGYSLLDDQLSGTGLRIAYSVVLSIPLVGTWMASLLFGGDFPGDRDHQPPLRDPRPTWCPVVIGVLLAVHLALVVRHKHTQFPGAGATRGQRRRRAPLADLRGQGGRPVLPGRRRARPPRRARPDQPDLGLRPVPTGQRQHRCPSPTGTWAGSRGPAPHAAVGDPRLRLRAPQPVLPGRAAPRRHLRHAATPGRSWRRGSAATTPSTTSSTGPATARCARPSAWPRWPSTPCSAWAEPATRSRRCSTSRSTA